MTPSTWPTDVIDAPITSGPVLKVGILLAAAAALLLVVSRERRWWTRAVPIAAVVVAVLLTLALLWIQVWWKPFPDAIPPEVAFWGAVGIGGIVLAVARAVRHGRWRQRFAAFGLSAVVLLGALLGINHYYGEFPDLRSTLGLQLRDQTDLQQIPTSQPLVAAPTTGRTQLDKVWRPPAAMPAEGVVVPIDIPPTRSKFPAQPGWAYLPPAYLSTPRAELPVLILLSGQPGTARDWLNGGQLAHRMDEWASAHQGLAPVVVMPDFLGNPLHNPLCVNSSHGNVDTYLSQDVPAFISATFQVQTDHRFWAIGGFSEGGTCALQMATNHPTIYPTFLSLSGNAGPYKDSHAKTVADYFGGSQAAFLRVNPPNLLYDNKYPHSAGAVLNSAHDENPESAPYITLLCRHAGMTILTGTVPGTHSWSGWGNEAGLAFPWLFRRWGLGT